MSKYFNYCLVKNKGDVKKAMNEFLGRENTSTVPLGTTRKKEYIHLDENIVVAKHLIEAYSVESYLAKHNDVKPEKTDLYLRLYSILDINYHEILLERFDRQGARCTSRKPYLIESLKEGRCKVTIDSLALLIQVGLLENK